VTPALSTEDIAAASLLDAVALRRSILLQCALDATETHHIQSNKATLGHSSMVDVGYEKILTASFLDWRVQWI
jgi:hypothetical protein